MNPCPAGGKGKGAGCWNLCGKARYLTAARRPCPGTRAAVYVTAPGTGRLSPRQWRNKLRCRPRGACPQPVRADFERARHRLSCADRGSLRALPAVPGDQMRAGDSGILLRSFGRDWPDRCQKMPNLRKNLAGFRPGSCGGAAATRDPRFFTGTAPARGAAAGRTACEECCLCRLKLSRRTGAIPIIMRRSPAWTGRPSPGNCCAAIPLTGAPRRTSPASASGR